MRLDVSTAGHPLILKVVSPCHHSLFRPHAARSKSFLQDYLMMYQKFTGQIIAVTGDGPYYEEAIERIVRLEGAALGGRIGNDGSWQENQIIVIGRDDFGLDYLIESINVGLRHGFTCRYMSQEAFWDLWLWDEHQPYYKGDPRVEEHPGLSYLASVGFEWPTFKEVQGTGTLDNAKAWNTESILKSKFGYHVRKQLSEKTRRKRLQNAVTAQDGLGLKAVAEHIAFLIRLNRGKCDESLEGALGRWKSDLDWLHESFYAGSAHRFVWPNF